jgi:hypothetical protein
MGPAKDRQAAGQENWLLLFLPDEAAASCLLFLVEKP